MSNKEIVQQGLDARKNTRAAEAKAARYRELVDVTRDTLFREQMSHSQARRLWMEEKTVLNGLISRQNSLIANLRGQLAFAEDRAREERRFRALISGVKAVSSLFILVGIRDIGWVVPWLCDSLTALSTACLGVAIFNWLRNN